MEAHNFLLQALITTIHTKNEKKQDTKLVALARTLAQLVFSIGTSTSKVTEDDMDESKEEDNSKEENKEQAVIEGMQMLSGKKSKAKLLETGKEDKLGNEGTKEREFKDFDVKMRKAGEELATRMEEAPSLLVDSEEDSYNTPASQEEDPKDIHFSKGTTGVKSTGEEPSLKNYDLEALEVSSGKFEAAHGQKYQEPTNFIQVLWNKAGPLVGIMMIMLDLMKNEFRGEIAGLQTDMANIPQQLINFLIDEVGKNPCDAINFIDKIIDQLEEYKEEESAGDHQGDLDVLPPNKGKEQSKASKTQ
jgi:hypothetical protein